MTLTLHLCLDGIICTETLEWILHIFWRGSMHFCHFVIKSPTVNQWLLKSTKNDPDNGAGPQKNGQTVSRPVRPTTAPITVNYTSRNRDFERSGGEKKVPPLVLYHFSFCGPQPIRSKKLKRTHLFQNECDYSHLSPSNKINTFPSFIKKRKIHVGLTISQPFPTFQENHTILFIIINFL